MKLHRKLGYGELGYDEQRILCEHGGQLLFEDYCSSILPQYTFKQYQGPAYTSIKGPFCVQRTYALRSLALLSQGQRTIKQCQGARTVSRSHLQMHQGGHFVFNELLFIYFIRSPKSKYKQRIMPASVCFHLWLWSMYSVLALFLLFLYHYAGSKEGGFFITLGRPPSKPQHANPHPHSTMSPGSFLWRLLDCPLSFSKGSCWFTFGLADFLCGFLHYSREECQWLKGAWSTRRPWKEAAPNLVGWWIQGRVL